MQSFTGLTLRIFVEEVNDVCKNARKVLKRREARGLFSK